MPDLGKRTEYLIAGLVLLVFFALQTNAISKGNYAGQDYRRHSHAIIEAAQDPGKTLTTPNQGTPTTLYHILQGQVYKALPKENAWDGVAFVNCATNMVALIFFYVLIRMTISSQLIRLSCFIFICFLPLTVITSGVVATDAFSSIYFVLSVLALLNVVQKLKEDKDCKGWLLACSAFLTLACLNKFIYGFCIIAVMPVALLLIWGRALDAKKTLFSFSCIIAAAAAACLLSYSIFIKTQAIPVGQAINHISFHNLLFLNRNDAELLEAPYFHQVKQQEGKFFRPCQENNYYSYPALMHAAVFTDFLNIYQPIRWARTGVEDEYYTRVRPEANAKKMKLAVRTGLIFSCAALFALLWFLRRIFMAINTRQWQWEDIATMILFIFALTLFAGMSLGLPFTNHTYIVGTWLPRHVMPALLSFAIILFAALNHIIAPRFPRAAWLVFFCACAQSLLHISFLWVTP